MTTETRGTVIAKEARTTKVRKVTRATKGNVIAVEERITKSKKVPKVGKTSEARGVATIAKTTRGTATATVAKVRRATKVKWPLIISTIIRGKAISTATRRKSTARAIGVPKRRSEV